MLNKIAHIILLILCVGCWGCASFLSNDSSRNFNVDQHAGVGVVVGKLKTDFPINSEIVVEHTATGKLFNIVNDATYNVPDKSGNLNMFYCVALPEGIYALNSIETRNAHYEASPINLNLRFVVGAGRVQYLGGLTLKSQDMMHSGSSRTMRLRLKMEDEYETVKQELKNQCPWLAREELVKTVMRH